MKKPKKPKAKKLSADERKKLAAQRRHIRQIRSIFSEMGFNRIESLAGKQVVFKGTESDIDDMFTYENIFVFVEYTTGSDISGHLKKKYVLYKKIIEAPNDFLNQCRNTYVGFPAEEKYANDQSILRVLYCYPSDVKQSLKDELDGIYFFDIVIQNYFKRLAATIHTSARYDLFAFFKLTYEMVGDGMLAPGGIPTDSYDGSVLPESSSSFPPDYKVVSFYIDPDALLPRAYVLRNEGWRDESGVYQRMILKKKIDSIREYLHKQHRVFVNNIVVTLPPETKILDEHGDTVPVKKLTKTSLVSIQIPRQFNSIGLIDGQHRVLSYHEGGKYDSEISLLRKKQNLLATGIIYPSAVNSEAKARFEAKLFLEINSTQAAAKSDLKQAISLLLTPSSEISLAKRIVNFMNRHGPLEGRFVKYSFEKDKLKTTSIVSYGVRNLIRFQGSDSLFSVWTNPAKADVREGDDATAELYVKYCAREINLLLSALKDNLSEARWTTSNKVPGRVLSTTVVNGVIVCLRHIVDAGKEREIDIYRKRLKGVDSFNFGEYRSSQYGALGSALFSKYFS
jgi:DGQHR domain-containing protein